MGGIGYRRDTGISTLGLTTFWLHPLTVEQMPRRVATQLTERDLGAEEQWPPRFLIRSFRILRVIFNMTARGF